MMNHVSVAAEAGLDTTLAFRGRGEAGRVTSAVAPVTSPMLIAP